jgi:hypothetical protein
VSHVDDNPERVVGEKIAVSLIDQQSKRVNAGLQRLTDPNFRFGMVLIVISKQFPKQRPAD